jgi:hypothetical protein
MGRGETCENEGVCKTKKRKREYNTGFWPTTVGGEGFRSRKAMAMPAEEQKVQCIGWRDVTALGDALTIP